MISEFVFMSIKVGFISCPLNTSNYPVIQNSVQRQGQRRSHGTWRSPIRTAENGQQDQAAAPGNTVPSGNNNNTGTPAVPPGGSGGSVGQNGQGHVGPGSTF